MQIDDHLDHAIRSAKGTKEWACRSRPDDVHPYVVAYRGEEVVALTTLEHHRRDEILYCAELSAAGFDADVLAVTFEAYASCEDGPDRYGVNPLTGRAWGPGEMEDVARNHNGIADGLVAECLMVTVVNRAGDLVAHIAPFRFSGEHLVWSDAKAQRLDENHALAGGIVPDTLREIMRAPSASQVLWRDLVAAFDRADRDIATARYLASAIRCAPLVKARSGDDPERPVPFGGGS